MRTHHVACRQLHVRLKSGRNIAGSSNLKDRGSEYGLNFNRNAWVAVGALWGSRGKSGIHHRTANLDMGTLLLNVFPGQ